MMIRDKIYTVGRRGGRVMRAWILWLVLVGFLVRCLWLALKAWVRGREDD